MRSEEAEWIGSEGRGMVSGREKGEGKHQRSCLNLLERGKVEKRVAFHCHFIQPLGLMVKNKESNRARDRRVHR